MRCKYFFIFLLGIKAIKNGLEPVIMNVIKVNKELDYPKDNKSRANKESNARSAFGISSSCENSDHNTNDI